MTSVMIVRQPEHVHPETFTMERYLRTAILVAMGLAVAGPALPTQRLSAGTYTVVVDPNATNTGNIHGCRDQPAGDQL